MKKVKLLELRCIETEDISGSDTPYLEILYVDRVRKVLCGDLNNGEKYQFHNKIFNLDKSLVISLYDEDTNYWFDKNDFISSHTLRKNKKNGQYVDIYKGNGAKYELYYEVFGQNKNTPQKEPDILSSFRENNKSGVWTYIDKDTLIEGLKARKAIPSNINQRTSALCGSASIGYSLLKNNWNKYAQICIELWEEGKTTQNGYTIKASHDLRTSGITASIASVDWIFMTSIRETENYLLDIENNDLLFSEYSYTGAMKKWSEKILDLENVKIYNCFWSGEIENIKKAQTTLNRGGTVFLLINSSMLQNNHSSSWIPNHWITLNNIHIDFNKEIINMEYYTWGQVYRKDFTFDSIENNLFSVIIGESKNNKQSPEPIISP